MVNVLFVDDEEALRMTVGDPLRKVNLPAVRQFTSRMAAVLLLEGVLMSSGAPAFAQMNTAEIDGQVKDPSGASIARADITATQTATQQKYNTITNDAGFSAPTTSTG